MSQQEIHKAIRILRKLIKAWKVPVVTQVSWQNQPFWVLISCLLSLRTRDEVTELATRRLRGLAESPEKMLLLKPKQIEEAIYPAAFYKVKTGRILEICRELVEHYSGSVPNSIDELLKFKGVGRKTANLTVTLGFGKPGICVDTHVHRIVNRWGYLKTKNPDATETALREKLPKRYWLEINNLLVSFGQNRCKPVSPLCSQCELQKICSRIGVSKSR